MWLHMMSPDLGSKIVMICQFASVQSYTPSYPLSDETCRALLQSEHVAADAALQSHGSAIDQLTSSLTNDQPVSLMFGLWLDNKASAEAEQPLTL